LGKSFAGGFEGEGEVEEGFAGKDVFALGRVADGKPGNFSGGRKVYSG
jgi:hypothetical protein